MKLSKVFQSFALTLIVAVGASAQTRGIGVGGYLQAGNSGEDGGLNAKLFLNQMDAIDLSLSIQMSPFGESMGAYVSYLFHYWNVIPMTTGKLPLYWGPNGGVGTWPGGSVIRFGAVGGMDYCLPQGTAPLDFYLQLNPNIEAVSPKGGKMSMGLNLYLQLGMRFFFGG